MTTSTTAEATIRQLEDAIEAACVQRDVEFLRGVYSDDFTMKHGDGRLTPKAEWLDIIETGRESWVSREIIEHVVDLHDDVALTIGRLNMATPHGRRYTLRYVRVLAVRDGRWQLLAHRTLDIHDL